MFVLITILFKGNYGTWTFVPKELTVGFNKIFLSHSLGGFLKATVLLVNSNVRRYIGSCVISHITAPGIYLKVQTRSGILQLQLYL